ncbi:hypothetical protein DNC95_27925, partial [Escherichia coli]|nr:hypothetical protein [Escherichia coli]
WNYNREFDGKWVMDLHSEAAKRLQPCAELRALASAVGGRLFRLNGYKGVIFDCVFKRRC